LEICFVLVEFFLLVVGDGPDSEAGRGVAVGETFVEGAEGG